MKRWLVLGSGAIARECFLPAFEYLNMLPELTVIDLTVPDDLRQAYSQVDFLEGDFRCPEILQNRELQAAVVTLPNQFHEEAATRMLEAGAHVLCEKPLALTEASCLRMRDVAAKAKRRLSVNMVRRFYPSIRMMGKLIRDGRVGELQTITIEHGGPFAWPARSLAAFLPENGGVFADMGVHYLDLVESFTGPLELTRYSDDSRGGVEAESYAELRSAAGAVVHIRLSRLKNLANTITLVGTAGRIEMPVDSFSSLTLYRSVFSESVEIKPVRAFQASSLPVSFAGCFVDKLQDFKNRIDSGDHSLEEVESAARHAKVIEQAYRTRSSERSTPQATSVLTPGPALVTGATGFIGAHFVRRLFDEGFSAVTGLVRRPQTCAPIARFPIKMTVTNLLDRDAVQRAVTGQRYVFHLAYGRDGADADAVTVQGTQNIVDAAIIAGCEAVVILSTINVIGWPDGEADESAPYHPAGGAYGKTKAQMERWCLKRAQESGRTRIALLLPSCVYGPGGKTFTELPAMLAKQGGFGWIANGQGLANYVYIDNLLDAILLAAAKPPAHGQRFLVNDGCTSWREFLEPIVHPWLSSMRSYEPGELKRLELEARRGALKRAIKSATADSTFRRELKQSAVGSIARHLAVFSGVLSPSQGNPPRLVDAVTAQPSSSAPPSWIEDLFAAYSTRFSSAKLRSMLGWTPRVELAEGQRAAVDYLISTGLYPER